MPKPWQVGQTTEQEAVQAQQRAIHQRDALDAGASYEESQRISGWDLEDYGRCRMLPGLTGPGASTFATGTYLRRGGNADINEVAESGPAVSSK